MLRREFPDLSYPIQRKGSLGLETDAGQINSPASTTVPQTMLHILLGYLRNPTPNPPMVDHPISESMGWLGVGFSVSGISGYPLPPYRIQRFMVLVPSLPPPTLQTISYVPKGTPEMVWILGGGSSGTPTMNTPTLHYGVPHIQVPTEHPKGLDMGSLLNPSMMDT